MQHSRQETRFHNAFGVFELHRRPRVNGLKAWDGADDLLLELAALELAAAHPSRRALIINDNFGALACALHTQHPVCWSDSCTSHFATQANWTLNQLAETCSTLPATEQPVTSQASTSFDLIVWRAPKSTALFEQQIAQLFPIINAQTVIFVGGMDKHLLPDTKTLLTRLGRVTTLPGKRKSHVFQIEFDPSLPAPQTPQIAETTFPEYGLTLGGDANVFAREKLDIGARFFIEHFPQLPGADLPATTRIADLGCGNGILSLALAKLRPNAEIHAFDESYQAIASARANWQRNIGEPVSERFHIGDGLSHYDGAAFDLILCNPPFHQQHVIGDHIARQLFTQSKQHLRKGGELWIVGNRHLDYQSALKRLFGNCRQIAANAKFVVLAARRQDTQERSAMSE